MERTDCNTKSKYVHLKESERYKIEVLLADGKNAESIARLLKRNRATIYREMKRGTVVRERWDRLGEYSLYRAHVGQAEYEKRGKNKERGLKIGKDKELEAYVREWLVEKRYSPEGRSLERSRLRGCDLPG